jgi:hypothetical protein
MADLRINDIEPYLLQLIKMRALQEEKTLRQFVIDVLRKESYKVKTKPVSK